VIGNDPLELIERCIERLTQTSHRRISTARGSERDFFQEAILRKPRSLPLAVLIRRRLTFQCNAL
jgi:hypothetical protein